MRAHVAATKMLICLFPAYQSRANLYNVNCTRLLYTIPIFHMIFHTRIAIIKRLTYFYNMHRMKKINARMRRVYLLI